MSDANQDTSGSSKQPREQSRPKPSTDSLMSMKRMKSFMTVPQLVSDDPASQKKRIGLLHSIIMGFCLMVLLMTILATQEPYRYIRSNLALQKGALLASLREDPDLNIDALWDWVNTLSKEIGGQTYKEVLLNCGYGPYEAQIVEINGKNVSLLNPVKQEAACDQSSLGFIDGGNDPLYLIGSHQILATGVFTKRANTHFPIKGSVASTETMMEVNSDKSEPLNPLKDNKVVEVCSVDISATPAASTNTPQPTPIPLQPTLKPSPLPAVATAAQVPAPASPGPGPTSRRSLQEEGGGDGPGMVRYTCIHKDGFANEDAAYTPGSTMNWQGALLTQDGQEYFAYDADRLASIFQDSSKTFTSYPPCFIIGEDDGLVYAGVREFTGTAQELRKNLTGCGNTWISKGRDFRTQCLDQQETGSEAMAQQSYLAGFNGAASVPEMYEMIFGCETLINWDVTDIDNAFVEAKRPIEWFLAYDESYGAFFPTANEKAWVEDAILGTKTLRMHGFFDKQTTEATVYIITRNLDGDALFYSMVKVSFTFRVNGYSNVKYKVIFSPMTQYDYGSDGYLWRNRYMYVWEIMFLVLFGLFAMREVCQVITSRMYPCLTRLCGRTPVVFPVDTTKDKEEGNDKDEDEDKDDESLCEVPIAPSSAPLKSTTSSDSAAGAPSSGGGSSQHDGSDEVHEMEEGRGHQLSSESLVSVSPAPPEQPPSSLPGQVATGRPAFIDLNHDGKDDFEQLGHFIHDLNDNGIDDAEELRELVDDLLPDAAGLLDILDWLTIAIVSFTIYFRLDYIHKTSDLHEFFIELAEEQTYRESMTAIINRFAAIDDNLAAMNGLVMVLVFFGIVQFFRYLSFDRRLGIVTATIKESLGSLLPVLIIFMVVMFAYAALGTVMYGAHLNGWSNIGKSMSQLFLLILGEFNTYYDIMQINPILSAVFFWTYITMALFLLFNMVLAVIFTVYEEKNHEITAMEAAEKSRLLEQQQQQQQQQQGSGSTANKQECKKDR